MRKVLLVVILSLMFSDLAVANGYGYGHGSRHHHSYTRPAPYYNWIAPAIIGGAVGYGLYRYNQPTIVQQPVIVQQSPIVQQVAPESYRYVTAYDPECSCYKQVLIPN
jgi:hypothetical protein